MSGISVAELLAGLERLADSMRTLTAASEHMKVATRYYRAPWWRRPFMIHERRLLRTHQRGDRRARP